MSKYNWIFQSNDLSMQMLTSDEAIAAIAVVIFCGSHSLADVDIGFLVDTLSGFEVFEQYSHKELWQMIDKLVATAVTEGVGALFNAANEVLVEELILDGFAAGVSVLIDTNIFAISRVHGRLLKQLQTSLEISDEDAEQVIEDVLSAFEEAWEEEDHSPQQSGLNSFYTATTALQAEITDIYISPEDNFRVPIPVASEFGGKVESYHNAVTFTDAEGVLLRIDYYQIPREFKQQIEQYGREKYFQTILWEKYIPQVILENISNSTVEYSEFCPDIFAGAYFVVVKMPLGSNLCQHNSEGLTSRLNAYRGLMAFDYNCFFYVITSQSSYAEAEAITEITAEAEMLKQEILDFTTTIQFN